MARRQQEKSLQTKSELMHSAMKVFAKKGFEAATIAEITEDAGYAKGNFYRYWKNKDDIFLDIMETRLKEYRASRQRGLERATTAQEVMNVLIDFLETIIDDKKWSKIFLEFTIHASTDPELKKKLNRSNYRLSTELFAQILYPFTRDFTACKKLGALVTALFEGFLIQLALETDVLSKQDLRQAMLILSQHILPGDHQTA